MHYLRLIFALLVFGAVGCGDATTEDSDQASDWWDDTASTSETTDTATTPESGTDDKPDTGDKPDDGDKPDSGGTATTTETWSAVIDTELGTGTFTYENTTESGENCRLSYPVSEASALETCESCAFAWDLQLGEVAIELDEGGCGEFAEISNHSVNYGQGSTVVIEYEGTSYYDLYYSEDGEVWENTGGYSSTAGSSWTFGTK